jgi:hypothetical protein
MLGIEILGENILAISATPEMAIEETETREKNCNKKLTKLFMKDEISQ